FRQHIQIEGIVPDDTMQRILAYRSIIEEDPTAPFAILDQKYFPVQFVITLNKPASWDLSDNDAKNFLDSLINTYYEWFTEYYGNYSLVSELDANDSFLKFEDYDYVDQLSLCEIPLDRLNTFLTEKNTEKGDFISPSTGLRFSDILQQANVLKDVDATQIDSLIYGFNLTKDKNRLLAIYNSQVLNLQINLEAAKKTVTNIEQAIASYERTQSTLLLPSYGGSEGESAAPLTVSGSEEYDNLTRQKVDAYATVTSIEASIKKLQDRSQRLSNNVEIVPGARREVYEATVEANLRKLRDDINSLVKVTNTVAEEYYKGFVFQDAIQTAIPSSVQSPISLKILLLLFAGCALGIPFLILVWYVVRAFFHVSKQQRENVNV
ncbi:MAG: hypothetical protein LBM16_03580, partial [Clostridiales bacterium]|nr:hypothetical protein [Clostridiales bacterium]